MWDLAIASSVFTAFVCTCPRIIGSAKWDRKEGIRPMFDKYATACSLMLGPSEMPPKFPISDTTPTIGWNFGSTARVVTEAYWETRLAFAFSHPDPDRMSRRRERGGVIPPPIVEYFCAKR